MTEENIRAAVMCILRAAGLPAGYMANRIIAEAVVQFRRDPSALYGNWCGGLCEQTARTLGVTKATVLGRISRAIEFCRELDGCRRLNELIGFGQGRLRPRELIARLAEVIDA